MSSIVTTGGNGQPARGRRPARQPRPTEHVGAHLVLRLATERPTEFIDITDRLEAFVDSAGMQTGILAVQSLHTTVGITVNEHEPLLLEDFERRFERWAARGDDYAHDDLPRRLLPHPPHEERVNGHAHCRALLLGPSVCLGIAGGHLLLGRWQRVLVVELDGPQARQVVATLVGSGLASSLFSRSDPRSPSGVRSRKK